MRERASERESDVQECALDSFYGRERREWSEPEGKRMPLGEERRGGERE